ncbi:MAG: discoidin domain-containing protein, partial [Planctomycetota bacterium]
DRSQWKADSSSGTASAARAINGKSDSCDNANQPGKWFQLDLGELHTVTALKLTSANNDRYPREWQLTLSCDGKTWSEPLCTGKGESASTVISMEPVVGRYFKIELTAEDSHHRWSIIDVQVFGAVGDVRASASPLQTEKPLTVEQLSGLNGDPTKGATVFARTCVKCHVIDGKGTNFGPDLSKVAARLKNPQIVESILNPDAVVDPKHRGEMIITSEGKLLSGFVTAESAESISLRTSDNVVHKVPVNEIDARKQLEKSFMPSGLDRTMTREELVNLVEFLTQQK